MKRFFLLFVIGAAVIIAGGVALLPLIIKASPGSQAKAAATLLPSPLGLPGLLTSPAPWPSNSEQVEARFRILNIPTWQRLPTAAMHIHQHVDIYVHGKSVAVPGFIGISIVHRIAGSIHTEDDTAVIHIESPVVEQYYLGQFFDIWGVRFDISCLGSYCTSSTDSLLVYVNGVRYMGDPRKLPLSDHQEIAIVFGSAAETPKNIPASYRFPYDPS